MVHFKLKIYSPMMRSHGEGYPREIYQFGNKGTPVYNAIEKYINLRYLLLPYIYSTSWQVTASHSSMMRALMMDFPEDKKSLDINDEYLFGKSFLVSPVTKPMYWKNKLVAGELNKVEDYSIVKDDEVYLPGGTDWYDFWTGKRLAGGQTVFKKVPLDIIPLYVKAGSIIPLGPKVQYAGEKKWDSLEIRIYTGADGNFTLYEDENDNYNYEKGLYSTIKFEWNNKHNTLTINKLQGDFPGILKSRVFNIVLVDTKKGFGDKRAETYDKTINYMQDKVVFKFK